MEGRPFPWKACFYFSWEPYFFMNDRSNLSLSFLVHLPWTANDPYRRNPLPLPVDRIDRYRLLD